MPRNTDLSDTPRKPRGDGTHDFHAFVVGPLTAGGGRERERCGCYLLLLLLSLHPLSFSSSVLLLLSCGVPSRTSLVV